jgi:hypothetical protein
MKISTSVRCLASGLLLLCLIQTVLAQTVPRGASYFKVSWPNDGAVFQQDANGKGRFKVLYTFNSSWFPQNVYRVTAILTPISVKTGQVRTDRQVIEREVNIFSPLYGITFSDVPAGLYTLKMRATPTRKPTPTSYLNTAETPAQKVGVGEVFIIAGQSNAQGLPNRAGSIKVAPYIGYDGVRFDNSYRRDARITEMIDALRDRDVRRVRGLSTYPSLGDLSSTAQIGNLISSGVGPTGLSLWYWALVGQLIVDNKDVPVAFFNAAWGGTTITEWARSIDPNKRVMSRGLNTNPLGNSYPAGGLPFSLLSRTLNLYGSIYGVRAVLWMQGETDNFALTSGSVNTEWGGEVNMPNFSGLPDSYFRYIQSDGDYTTKLRAVIAASRNVFPNTVANGKPVPWIVAKASHFGGNNNATVRLGQANAVSEALNIKEGPDMDLIINTSMITNRRRVPSDNTETDPSGIEPTHFKGTGLELAASSWYSSIEERTLRGNADPITVESLGTEAQSITLSEDGQTLIAPEGVSYRWLNETNGTTESDEPISTGSQLPSGGQQAFSGSQGAVGSLGMRRVVVQNSNGNFIMSQAVPYPFYLVDDSIEDTSAPCLEAESQGGGQNDTNASGGQFVGFGNAAEGRDYTVNVSTAGTYSFTLTYASPEGPTIGIRLNGGAVQAVGLPASSGWSTYRTHDVAISLPAGNSTLRVQGGSGYVRFDKFCYGSGTPPPVGCDFTPSVSASTESPSCGGSVSLTANCTGADCNGLSYSWSNSGGSNATASYTLPNSNGTHTYTLTMSRSGCSNKTADKSFTLSGCTTTDPTHCIEAETSTTSMDVQNSGQASGGQFVGNFGEASAYAHFAVNVASGGDKTITLTYAAAGSSKQVRVQVNDGAEQTLTLASTGGWESFATQAISVNLPTGSSTLKIKGVADNYWRLDKLCLPSTPPPVGNCYEGESLGGGQNDSNASGGQFIGFGNQYEGRDYSVNATGTLRITYASGDGPTIGVKIGSGSVQAVTLGATPGWSSYQTVNTNISVSGATTVRIQGGSGYVRLDRFCISSGARQAAPEPNVTEADELNLRIVPNPSNGRFVARFRTVAAQAATLTLTDEAGRAVRAAQTIMGTGAEHAETIQLPAQVRGVLLLQVVSGSQRSSQKVLIE